MTKLLPHYKDFRIGETVRYSFYAQKGEAVIQPHCSRFDPKCEFIYAKIRTGTTNSVDKVFPFRIKELTKIEFNLNTYSID